MVRTVYFGDGEETKRTYVGSGRLVAYRPRTGRAKNVVAVSPDDIGGVGGGGSGGSGDGGIEG